MTSMYYPTTQDPKFQNKIAGKKEFDYKYDSSKKSGETTPFTLAPHQEFVKRFISYNSYYNGLLLYHGLGSGKTCSAIGITEETRKYIKYHMNFKPIIIVASINVQANFRIQLFDKNKLEKIKGQWVIHGCLGSSLLDEIGLSHVNELDQEQIIRKINKLIKKYYVFMGYIEFANLIDIHNKEALKRTFEDRLIVIDEIHNIRTTREGSDQSNMQKVAKHLEHLVTNVKYMKLIFLTGTPMFNGHEEIIFMLNLLNLNDKNPKVPKTTIFKNNGEFQKDGQQKLMSMANGYISYVRGENPYTFPFLIPPSLFQPERALLTRPYPSKMFNESVILEPIEHLDLYLSELEGSQKLAYLDRVASLIKKKYKSPTKLVEVSGLNYSELLKPLQCLNINYPVVGPSDEEEDNESTNGIDILGKFMTYKLSGTPKVYHSFSYKTPGHGIFNKNVLGEYSVKMKSIVEHIERSEGIVLIYSQWIYYGVLPMALCLEELGYSRFGSKTQNLMNNKKGKFSYSIICGNKELSPDIDEEIEALTNKNTHGERVRVVIISQTGTEGIDLKNIRQVHILEPWYNMNRIEQVIGRARRNRSHKELPETHRCVEVFLHSCTLSEDIEPLDMYLYRVCEKKNKIIGKVSRLLKEVSVDCLLNESQKDFATLEGTTDLILSHGASIRYEIKDKPYTNICDYQESCEYVCQCDKKDTVPDISTYNYKHITNDQLTQQLKLQFKDRYVYTYSKLKSIMEKWFPFMKDEEFEYAIEQLMHEEVYDKYAERGKIIMLHDLLLFQPYMSNYNYISTEERMNPIVYSDKFDMEEIQITPPKYLDQFKEKVEKTLEVIKDTNLQRVIPSNSFIEFLKSDHLVSTLIERQFEYVTSPEQLVILNDLEAGADDAMKEAIYNAFVVDNLIPLLDPNVLRRTTKYYRLKNGRWEETDEEIPPVKRKEAPLVGFIKLTGQNRRLLKIGFDYRPHDAKKQVPGKEIKDLFKMLTGDSSFTIGKVNKATLELLLELYLRHLDKNPRLRYFYYKYEPLIKIE